METTYLSPPLADARGSDVRPPHDPSLSDGSAQLPGNLLRPDRSLTLAAQNGSAARSGEFIFSHVLTVVARNVVDLRFVIFAICDQAHLFLSLAVPYKKSFKIFFAILTFHRFSDAEEQHSRRL